MRSSETTVTQAYRFALDPTPRQARILASNCGGARFAYNWGLKVVRQRLNERHRALEAAVCEGLSFREALALARKVEVPWSLPALRRLWNTAKEDVAPWWADNSKEAYSSGLEALARGLKNYSDSRCGRRKGKEMGFPHPKKKRAKHSCRFTTGSIRAEPSRHHVTLPRIGRIKTHESTRKLVRRLEAGTARILSASISQDATGRWHVTCEAQRRLTPSPHAGRLAPKGVPVGVDLGMRDLVVAATPDGREVLRVTTPQPLQAAQVSLRRLQKKVCRQEPLSNRSRLTRERIGRVHSRVANVRRDTISKLTTRLAQGCDVIVLEDLNVSAMGRKKKGQGRRGQGFNRSLANASFGEIRRQMSYKTRWYGSDLVVADRWWPSSKLCSRCGSRKPNLSLSERTYACTTCGLMIDRDLNAAVNLARLGETDSIGEQRLAGSGPVKGRGADRDTDAAIAADAGGREASTRLRSETVG